MKVYVVVRDQGYDGQRNVAARMTRAEADAVCAERKSDEWGDVAKTGTGLRYVVEEHDTEK